MSKARENLKHAQAFVQSIQGRSTKARARGGVELHLSLEDVDALCALANAGLRAYAAQAVGRFRMA